MTGLDHEHSAAVEEAALWFAAQANPPRPAVPALRSRFNLTPLQACEAISMAGSLKRGGSA